MTREPGSIQGPPLARGLVIAWISVSAVLMLLSLYREADFGGPVEYFLWVQDFPVLLALTALFVGMLFAPPMEQARFARTILERPLACTLILALFVFALSWSGRSSVFGDFAFSRDEDLALYQAKLILHGQLSMQVPPDWRGAALALQPVFVLVLPGDAAWLSSYLPVNSALHAAGLALGAEALVSPLLAAVAVVATYGVGRRLWPDKPASALLAAAFLATSSQLVVTAMTAYAMTAHLALNMVWLWLFLRGGRLGHLGAIAVGVLAVGLHQFIFHPLFVAPFVLQLWLDRRWRLAAGYMLAYAVICLCWIFYWNWATALAGATAQTVETTGSSRVLRDIAGLLSLAKLEGVPMVAKHLVRFMTWQNPLAVALLALGLAPALRAGAYMRALALGILLTVVAVSMLIPSQTHGWGYRYLHGFLGSACLIAAFTWDAVARRDPGRAGMILATAFAAGLLLLPVRAGQAKEYVAPYRAAYARIASTPADVVLVEGEGIEQGVAMVRNDPWLSQRPLTLYRRDLQTAEIPKICRRFVVGVFQASDAARQGIVTLREPAAARAAREARVLADLRAQGCRIVSISR